MKLGIRTPSIKKSIKARTTGRIKRTLKSTYNPAYSKKGMGVINSPKKSIYNKIYNKTTIDSFESVKGNSKKQKTISEEKGKIRQSLITTFKTDFCPICGKKIKWYEKSNTKIDDKYICFRCSFDKIKNKFFNNK